MGLVLLAGCTNVIGGSGHSKDALPAVGYDAAVYLCPSTFPGHPCRTGVTHRQSAAVRTQLFGDPAALEVLYLSERDVYRFAKLILPRSGRKLARVGDLPAEFMVKLVDPADDFDAFRSRYASLPGVQLVFPCRGDNCRVDVLRRAGVVH